MEIGIQGDSKKEGFMNRLLTGSRRYGRFAAAVGLVACVTAVAAGTGQGRTDRAIAPRSAQVTTITLAHWASSTVETQLLRQVLAAFKKRNPQIRVNELVLDPYPTQMLARFAAGRSPDVFYVDSNVFPDWLKQRLLEPLNAQVKRTHFKTNKFFPRLLNAFKQKDDDLRVPEGLVAARDGDQHEHARARSTAHAPTNWSQLRSLAQRMKNQNAVPDGAPLCLSPGWDRLLAFVYQNKGSFLNAAKTRATVNTGAVRDAVNYYVALLKDGLAKTPGQLGVGWCGEALGKEKAAIIFEGNWLLPYLVENFPSVGYKVYPLPRGKARGNLGFTVSYSMSRFSKNKKAAWKLLSFLTGKTGMRIWTPRAWRCRRARTSNRSRAAGRCSTRPHTHDRGSLLRASPT